MNERDKLILSSINRFRALSRDHLIQLHFSHLKTAVRSVNYVTKHLRERGYIKAELDRQPYVYHNLKRGSQKIDHYLAIADLYLELRKTGKLRKFDVEPKLDKKGTVEPDAFAIFDGWPVFIEIQRSNYSTKVMEKKLMRYAQFKREGKWRKLDWQKKEPIFPKVWIIGDREYKNVPDYVVQLSINEMISERMRNNGYIRN